MKKLILLILAFTVLGCFKTSKNKFEKQSFGIVIHGGAGTILKKNMTKEKENDYRSALSSAIKIGYDVLKNGGSSKEAVEKTINFMEDSPLFNAGKGGVLTSEGTIELDASFMDGKTLNAGAVSGVKRVKNPISAAIKVMEESPHVMLSGQGADIFSQIHNLEIVDQDYFITERRINGLKRVQNAEKLKGVYKTQNDRSF